MKAKTGSAIYRPDLGQAVMEFYETEATDFIGLQVMPLFPTAVQAASYPVIPKEALLKLFDTSREPRAKYKRDDFEYERGIRFQQGQTIAPLDEIFQLLGRV